MSNSKVIQGFFGVPGKPVSLTELKELSVAERAELAALIAEADPAA